MPKLSESTRKGEWVVYINWFSFDKEWKNRIKSSCATGCRDIPGSSNNRIQLECESLLSTKKTKKKTKEDKKSKAEKAAEAGTKPKKEVVEDGKKSKF